MSHAAYARELGETQCQRLQVLHDSMVHLRRDLIQLRKQISQGSALHGTGHMQGLVKFQANRNMHNLWSTKMMKSWIIFGLVKHDEPFHIRCGKQALASLVRTLLNFLYLVRLLLESTVVMFEVLRFWKAENLLWSWGGFGSQEAAKTRSSSYHTSFQFLCSPHIKGLHFVDCTLSMADVAFTGQLQLLPPLSRRRTFGLWNAFHRFK